MGETTIFLRRWRHRKTTIAGFLYAAAVGLRQVPGALHWADAMEAAAIVLLGTCAADAGKPL